MNIDKSTLVVSDESGFLEARVISFKELLFFIIIKKGEIVVIIVTVELSIISAIEVTDSKFTFSEVQWQGMFHCIKMVVGMVIPSTFIIRLSAKKTITFSVCFTCPSF